jgi:hypothetical protein
VVIIAQALPAPKVRWSIGFVQMADQLDAIGEIDRRARSGRERRRAQADCRSRSWAMGCRFNRGVVRAHLVDVRR